MSSPDLTVALVSGRNRRVTLDLKEFLVAFYLYLRKRLYWFLIHFEEGKDWLVGNLYQKRGRYTRPFEHFGLASLVVLAILIAPVIASSYPGFGEGDWQEGSEAQVLGVTDLGELATTTEISDKPRAEVLDYQVQPGDTVSQIAEKFNISTDTIRWANDLKSIEAIKPGQILKILPVTGISHKVQRGETVYSVAKKYSANSQAIVDWPFNTFVNDEEFTLAVGQILIIPDGIMPKQTPWSPTYIAQKTPDAGTVTASGVFVWPASGTISQGYRWYHQAIDIANKASPAILAADSGQVVVAGWPDGRGYGNRVVIDHGNGFSTLYAHLSQVYVKPGQTVNRGDAIGQMGCTGRCTGTHLHFEIRIGGGLVNPLGYLK